MGRACQPTIARVDVTGSHTIWQIAAKSDVGDVVEGKFPGGGRTRLSSIGSHNVGQMWLDR